MKCKSCGAYVERNELCFDCKRNEIERERQQLTIAASEEFQRNLVRDHLAGQQKALAEQTKDLDFREARRVILGLEMEALDNLSAAKQKARIFFDSGLYTDHAFKLTGVIAASPFLLGCCAEHELEVLNQLPAEDCLFYFEAETRHNPRLHDKIMELTEAGQGVAANLRPEIVTVLKRHHAQRLAETRRKEEEERLVREEFERACQEVLRCASSPVVEKLPAELPKTSPESWFQRVLAAIIPARRDMRRRVEEEEWRRKSLIANLTQTVNCAVRDHDDIPAHLSINQDRFVLAELLDRFDRRLAIFVVAHLVRSGWGDVRNAVIEALEEFEQTKGSE